MVELSPVLTDGGGCGAAREEKNEFSKKALVFF